MDDREQERSPSPWGARFVERYEYLLIYIAIVATLTLIVAVMGW